MDTTTKQVNYFHANAASIGGHLEGPFRFVPTPNSVGLSSSGGIATQTTKEFAFEDQVKLASAYSYVTGRHLQENGPWTERLVSVIEGVDLFGVVTADRIVAQAYIELPAAGGGPRKISFAGSAFTNLRINGKPVTLSLDGTLLPPSTNPLDPYNQDATCEPDIAWPELTDAAVRQAKALLGTKGLPDFLRSRFGWIAGEQPTGTEGYTLCSLINQVEGLAAGQCFGHCIVVPGFGTIYLAEVLVYPYSAHLTMLRAELCGKQIGGISCCCCFGNGSGFPPSAP